MDQYQRINTWHAEQYAYMMDRMKNMPEGNAHDPKDIPIVLVGKARGQFETGHHLKTRGDGELAALSLYHGMLKRVGAHPQSRRCIKITPWTVNDLSPPSTSTLKGRGKKKG